MLSAKCQFLIYTSPMLPDLQLAVSRIASVNPATGEVLGELAVCASDRLGALVEDEAGRSGGALVDRQDHG